MTLEDFNAQFDLYYDNIASNQAPGLNSYEKSVFLTDAQEEYVINLYNGRNPLGESFEQTEELRRYLSMLVEEAELTPIETTNGKPLGIDSKSKFFTLPDNPPVWFITYEAVIISDGKCGGTTSLEVVPVRQDEYHKIRKNPFRGANSRRALRLDLSSDNVEIVSDYTITKYCIRYFRKPKPIILENLEDGLTIEGEDTAMNCELPDSLHKAILMRAVELAIQSWNRQ